MSKLMILLHTHVPSRIPAPVTQEPVVPLVPLVPLIRVLGVLGVLVLGVVGVLGVLVLGAKPMTIWLGTQARLGLRLHTVQLGLIPRTETGQCQTRDTRYATCNMNGPIVPTQHATSNNTLAIARGCLHAFGKNLLSMNACSQTWNSKTNATRDMKYP